MRFLWRGTAASAAVRPFRSGHLRNHCANDTGLASRTTYFYVVTASKRVDGDRELTRRGTGDMFERP
jgi:hypothetical protein